MNSKSKICYNKKLLPYKHFKKINRIDGLKKYFLIRLPGKKTWSVKKKENFSKMIDFIEFSRGISMNLLSVYQHKDARIRPGGKVKDPHHQPWNELDNHILPPVINYKRRANYFGIKIENISSLYIDSVAVVFKNGNGVPDPCFSAFLKVVHSPTKCNYWHFEIKTYLTNPTGPEFELYSCSTISNKKKDRLINSIGEIFQGQIKEYLVHSSECRTKYLPKSVYRK